MGSRYALTGSAIAVLTAVFVLEVVPAHAHDAAIPIATTKLIVKTGGGERRVIFKVKNEDALRIQAHDPTVDGTSFVVRGPR